MVLVPYLKPQKERNAAVDRGYDITGMFYARLAGLYPDLEIGWRYWFFGSYQILVVVAYFYYVLAYVIANVIAIKYMDVELIGSTLCFGSYTYTYALIALTFYIKRSKIDKLLEIIGNELYIYQCPLSQKQLKIRNEETTRAKNFGRYSFFVPCLVALTHMSVVPAIHGFKGEYSSIVNGSAPINKYTPLPVWTPVQATSGMSFFVVFWCQLCPGFVEFLIFHGSCTFFVGVVCVLVSEIKILLESLNSITDRAKYLYHVKGGRGSDIDNLYDDPIYQQCMVDCLKENVKHHIKIKEFRNLFQDIISYCIFFIFGGAAVTISTPPYTILKIMESGDTDKLYSAGVVMMGHTFLSVYLLSRYCKFGQNFESENSKLLEAFYCTPWYNTNMDYRKILIIAMSNSQKTLQIKGSVVGVSLSAAAFLDVIKSSYSLLNFLATAGS
ncbi:hypothetical protein GE061_016239 [Apolygus lucorum]|uniref:Odorant receptor n=1 Tax=Apolygus lucorum TaxID=248454 RepID=A0A1Q1NIP2_APOLU|nr:olfactory receptor [Apolygus lucorum]KAF6207791.1 hypothetical protein GE061_016239 [Apolygus lucorum]QQL94656.1 olfactory receptor 2 [Apolygus lucorum]